MATYSTIYLPSIAGASGVHVPASAEAVRAALLLARCFVDAGGQRESGAGTAVRHLGLGVAGPTRPRGYFGTFSEEEGWSCIKDDLTSPVVPDGRAQTDTWVIAGCTIHMEHRENYDPRPQVSLSIDAPSGPEPTKRVMTRTLGDRVEEDDEWPWWIYIGDHGLRLRFNSAEIIPDEYDELYGALATAHPHRWVAAVVWPGNWDFLPVHATAPAVATPAGGFLEFVAHVHALRVSRHAATDAWTQFGVRGLWRWVVMRTSWLVGEAKIPAELIDAPRERILDFLDAPESLYWGYVEGAQRITVVRHHWWARRTTILKRRLSGGLHLNRQILDAFTVKLGWRRFHVRVMLEVAVDGDSAASGDGSRKIEITRGPRWLAGAADLH